PRLQVLAKADQRVTRLPLRDFLAAAVNTVVIGRRMRAVAVNTQLDQRRPMAGTGILDGLAHDVIHRPRVHAVHLIAGHAVSVGLVGNATRPGLLVGADTNGVAVVLAGKHHRRIAYAGQVHGRMPIAFAGGAVTEGDHHDLVLAL